MFNDAPRRPARAPAARTTCHDRRTRRPGDTLDAANTTRSGHAGRPQGRDRGRRRPQPRRRPLVAAVRRGGEGGVLGAAGSRRGGGHGLCQLGAPGRSGHRDGGAARAAERRHRADPAGRGPAASGAATRPGPASTPSTWRAGPRRRGGRRRGARSTTTSRSRAPCAGGSSGPAARWPAATRWRPAGSPGAVPRPAAAERGLGPPGRRTAHPGPDGRRTCCRAGGRRARWRACRREHLGAITGARPRSSHASDEASSARLPQPRARRLLARPALRPTRTRRVALPLARLPRRLGVCAAGDTGRGRRTAGGRSRGAGPCEPAGSASLLVSTATGPRARPSRPARPHADVALGPPPPPARGDDGRSRCRERGRKPPPGRSTRSGRRTPWRVA